jgi:uncharacterized protein YyaL (SSP411 family)
MIIGKSLFPESFKDLCKRVLYGLKGFPVKTGQDELHLQKVMEWLEVSCLNRGSRSHYDLIHGKWLHPFPETTGYIIPSFYDYADFSGEKRFAALAVELTDWLGEMQLENGGCMQGSYDPKKGKTAAVVFNTGQNILGFLRAFKETGRQKYLANAIKAGDFLVNSTDENGVWDKNLLRGLKHTINSRVAWALLELHKENPKPEYGRSAVANLDWTVAQQTENGWFRHGTSQPGGLPNTHFLSYTCEGLLQSYCILKNEEYLKAAEKTARRLLKIFISKGMLFAFWDENWHNHGKYLRWTPGRFVCLTGNAQIATVWMWLFEETGDSVWRDAAFKILDHLKALQDISSANEGIRGGIKGSFPVFGSYSAFKYPNWAAKFFADALLLKIKLEKQIKTRTNSQ